MAILRVASDGVHKPGVRILRTVYKGSLTQR